MSNVIGSIINDCADQNARARQELRFKSLFGVQPSFLGVDSYDAIEAAGNLIDQLDVLVNFPLVRKDCQAIVLVNVAPRSHDIKQKWDNGTPFCYFRVGHVLVVSAYEGHCLALARDLGVINAVQLLHPSVVTAAAVEWGDLTAAEADKINNSQFRSLEFLPLVAYWLWQGKPVPSEKQSLDGLPSLDGQAWCIDNFDNVKTTLLSEDVDFKQGKQVVLSNGAEATCYYRLADVPTGVTALTIGSSGLGKHRWLELAVGHQGRAAAEHGFKVGSQVVKLGVKR
jgi:hypothetical protein